MKKIKSGDTVKVICGKDKGKIGKVLHNIIEKNKVVVEGINIYKKNVKPNPQLNEQGGIIDKTMPIDVSNVALYDNDTQTLVKVGFSVINEKKVRINKKTKMEV
jgi:large subunit ribosomal protein L24